ncbi:MAG: phosphotransferase family protein [Conexibacter sp.]|nr:phosphotransferase family protein [Conexibacter sp.]
MTTPNDPDGARKDAALTVMREHGTIGAGAAVTDLRQLEGGWSRHSWALTVDDPDQGAVEAILRVRPQGAILDTDLGQEYRTYAILADEPVPIPAVYGMADDEDTPFGGPFFAMSRLTGWAPNVWRPKDRRVLEADWDKHRGYAEDLVDALAAIHALPSTRLHGVVTPRDFQQTLTHWHGIQHEMQLVPDPVIEEAYAWARDRTPPPVEPRLVHGDYRIGNCLVDDRRITGVLDWELSFLGDPRFDLGYMGLDYHAGKFAKPGSSLLNAVADREWFHARYAAATGQPVDTDVVRTFSVVGALMLLAILATGVRVYSTGQTDDIRMVWTRFALPGLRQDMIRLMDW